MSPEPSAKGNQAKINMMEIKISRFKKFTGSSCGLFPILGKPAAR
jgi:hypothetical protein